MGRLSTATSLAYGDAVEQWRKEMRADPRWAAAAQADIFSIAIELTELDEPDLRRQVRAIWTALRIGDEARGLLRAAARRSLDRSAELKRFLQSVADLP